MASDAELQAIVVKSVQSFAGAGDDLPLSTNLRADLGLDSLLFVTILFDLTDRLGLRLASPDTDLRAIQTLEDFVAFVRTLAPPRP